MFDSNGQQNWQEILQRIASIREQEDYSGANIDFIQEQLLSPDDRVRAGAALASSGCVFQPQVLDILCEIAEHDSVDAIRKASLRSLGLVIHEGVLRNFENEVGADTKIEFYEEWDELQIESLHDDYLRIKNLIFSIVQDDFEILSVRESGLLAISDLGFLQQVREWIQDFISTDSESSVVTALQAIGKYPQYWTNQLSEYLSVDQPKQLLLEAISSSYSSNSPEIAEKIEQLLDFEDPDILSYALLTLANINQTEYLAEILRKFSIHQNEVVNQAAQEALLHFTRKNFSDYMENELGYDDQ
jgi:HEAT repeat protein